VHNAVRSGADAGLFATEPESLPQLLGDCAHMAPHWHAAASAADASPTSGTGASAAPPPEALRGVRVPARSARLLDGMSEYGD
jgi:hypothetical protein